MVGKSKPKPLTTIVNGLKVHFWLIRTFAYYKMGFHLSDLLPSNESKQVVENPIQCTPVVCLTWAVFSLDTVVSNHDQGRGSVGFLICEVEGPPARTRDS